MSLRPIYPHTHTRDNFSRLKFPARNLITRYSFFSSHSFLEKKLTCKSSDQKLRFVFDVLFDFFVTASLAKVLQPLNPIKSFADVSTAGAVHYFAKSFREFMNFRQFFDIQRFISRNETSCL